MRGKQIVFGFVAMAAIAITLAACSTAPTATPTPAATATRAAVTPTTPAGTPAAPAPGGGNIDAGKTVFTQNCNGCHPNGEKGVGPNIKGKAVDVVKAKVRSGGGGMPPFSASQIGDQQLNDVAAYVNSLK